MPASEISRGISPAVFSSDSGEFYRKHYDVDPSADMLAHLKRELTHGSLRLIFQGSFADAQNNGRITMCADEIVRRWLLRLIFHSADYIEK